MGLPHACFGPWGGPEGVSRAQSPARLSSGTSIHLGSDAKRARSRRGCNPDHGCGSSREPGGEEGLEGRELDIKLRAYTAALEAFRMERERARARPRGA